MTRIAVMGAGSMGTCFGMIMSDAGGEVGLWARETEVAEDINRNHRNEMFHPGFDLPRPLWCSNDAEEVMSRAEIVVLALPAQVLRSNLELWRDVIPADALLVTLIKGIEQGTKMRMTQVIAEVADVPAERVAVVSGPNLAREIIQRQPAATTVACVDKGAAQKLQEAASTGYFRPYFTTDVVGVELGGSVKNVIALANGMAVGQGFGENSQAALVTRGLAEMVRLGVAMSANQLTFIGLAGVGDLLATCNSPLSRNRTFGENLGKGLTVEETVAVTKQTCEGVKSCQPILEMGQDAGVEMPITQQVVEVVHHGMKPRDMLYNLMSRPVRAEQGQSS
ncbi:MAG: NAD(P)H-dependent glycerol-3-phosphate dehydrogenase [Candidatus Nanopelagicales bacterium]|nr:NAD(P)H-dependent glycerol-3-phosphate dehydrogenase [Candidatus Nanopelagicales bacterium]MDZ4250878.1 NAD(P)H-dependent glycerol-3-phosphate dehydrogenase [Candidatus Nanopelagicales bacterium]